MITLYTKPKCPFCERAKDWLDKNNIEYLIVDITQNESARNMLKEAGHKTVPQIYLNGKVFVEGGFSGLDKKNPAMLKEEIKMKEWQDNAA